MTTLKGTAITPQAAIDRAVELSARGYPAPNPHVGCVLVKDGIVVGEGWHEYAGGPHAEAAALIDAGTDAEGSTAYVTLEPCNHFGRTPPCSQALIAAGVREVIIATPDPNPKAAGGAATLKAAGISTTFDETFGKNAAKVNHRFLHAMAKDRPEVTIKSAASLDGRIALPSGESKWITSTESRIRAQQLRAECGAVLVGRRTAELDNPQLTVRDIEVRNQPLRIVLDPRNVLDPHFKVFDESAETWHVTGRVELRSLLGELRRRGHTGLLVEGGGNTIATFIREKLADRLALFQAPVLLGDGPAWVDGLNIGNLAQAPRIRVEQIDSIGPDRLVHGVFE